MRRILGTGSIVLLVWVALEVYSNGVGGAFGGLFAGAFDRVASSEALQAPAERSTHDRAADAFQRAYDKSTERVDRVVGDD
jgi:hypothetical protein